MNIETDAQHEFYEVENQAQLNALIYCCDPFQDHGVPCWTGAGAPIIPWSPDEIEDSPMAENE